MALFDLDHLTGTNLNSQDSELKAEDLFDLTVTTQVRRNKAVNIDMLTQCRMHSRLLGPNTEWNNTAILDTTTILDTTQGK